MHPITTQALKLSIVFLNYNRLGETRATLQHLRDLIGERRDIEVIAVDNASVDHTGEFLRSQTDPWLRVIEMPHNTGIAGYNEGFKQAAGDYILVLDDDSHPEDRASLDRMIDILDQQPRVGVVACRIKNNAGATVASWHLPQDLEQAGHSMAFIGCGFAIRRDLFAAVGWYPVSFFLYQNEMEVAIQVRRQGYEILYAPDCQVVHRESPRGRPSWRRVYYPTRNTIWLIRRYFPTHSAVFMIGSRLLLGLVRAVQCGELKWYLKAVREALATPVQAQVLSPELRKELRTFQQQNSLWHHFLTSF